MNGDFDGSTGRLVIGLKNDQMLLIPRGINLISSHQITSGPYKLLQAQPTVFCSGLFEPHRSSLCWSLSFELASTRYILSILSEKLLKFRTVLNISDMSVPLPGPTSNISTPFRFPCAIHSATNHTPTNSPNIWEISGDVTKSPSRPNCADEEV